MGEFCFALADVLSHPPEHALTLKGRKTARGSKSLHRCGNGRFGVFTPALEYLRDYASVIRRSHFNQIAFLHPLAIHQKPLRADWSRNHFGHDVSLDLRPMKNR
jgi:hypothetical protein